MEAARSSETSLNFWQATWGHIQEDSNLHSPCCENFKSHDGDVTLLLFQRTKDGTSIIVQIIYGIK
jgi:hypothetical protein